jgi:hypothetical protein
MVIWDWYIWFNLIPLTVIPLSCAHCINNILYMRFADCYHSVIITGFFLSQSDHTKRLLQFIFLHFRL